MRKTLIQAVLIELAMLGVFFVHAYAQEFNNKTNIGFPENGAFDGDSFASVQMNNGNLHIEIPLWSSPGRGLPVTEKFVYDNKGWYLRTNCSHMGVCQDHPVPESGNNMILHVIALCQPSGPGHPLWPQDGEVI